jgi:hypothetical protein
MSWLHHVYPMLVAVDVKYGWKFNESQVMTVSPEKPTG